MRGRVDLSHGLEWAFRSIPCSRIEEVLAALDAVQDLAHMFFRVASALGSRETSASSGREQAAQAASLDPGAAIAPLSTKCEIDLAVRRRADVLMCLLGERETVPCLAVSNTCPFLPL